MQRRKQQEEMEKVDRRQYSLKDHRGVVEEPVFVFRSFRSGEGERKKEKEVKKKKKKVQNEMRSEKREPFQC